MEDLVSIEGLLSIFTLTAMEIILGIDNLLFISIISSRLPGRLQAKARLLGLAVALLFRIGLLFSISWLIAFTDPIAVLPSLEILHLDPNISYRDLILMAGGIFLFIQTLKEIRGKKKTFKTPGQIQEKESFLLIIGQIILVDVIFSVDSILTAVGLVRNPYIMVIAVVISILVMLIFANKIVTLLQRYPDFKLLALLFLIFISLLLVLEGLGLHIPKGYLYFSLGFSVLFELFKIHKHKKDKNG